VGVPVPTKRDVLAATAAAGLAALPLAVLAVDRAFLTYGTENDFLGQFLPEAKRILAGDSLRIDFHPPLYPFALAVAHRLGLDWFAAGLLLSWLAAVVSMVSAYLLFAAQGLRWAAWGALGALATSSVFVSFSAQATSDLFFLALYLSALGALVVARQQPTRERWVLAGVLVGLAALTRTNGITLVPVAVFAALGRATTPSHRAPGWAGLAALGTVLLLWVGIARVTDSPLWPRGNVSNLSLTYFAPGTDRISYEGFGVAAGRAEELEATWKDHPERIVAGVAKTYARDALAAARRLIFGDGFLLFPLTALALPGLVLLFAGMDRPIRRLLGLALVLQALLLNLKAFEPRYWLSMVPFLGAGAALTLQLVLRQLGSQRARRAVVAVLALLAVVEITRSLRDVRSELHSTDTELSEARIAAGRHRLGGGALEKAATRVL
jgi:4-amino-4-deoxy-L-arabinose transferase-like glycosyltransferase